MSDVPQARLLLVLGVEPVPNGLAPLVQHVTDVVNYWNTHGHLEPYAYHETPWWTLLHDGDQVVAQRETALFGDPERRQPRSQRANAGQQMRVWRSTSRGAAVVGDSVCVYSRGFEIWVAAADVGPAQGPGA